MKMERVLLSLFCFATLLGTGFATISSCFSRSSTSVSSNGSVASCGGSDTACYIYTNSDTHYAGCGSCPSAGSSFSCSTCSTTNCNILPSIECNVAAGIGSFSASARISCPGYNTCYSYSTSFFGTRLFHANCGNCGSFTSFSDCRTCSTNYCNSGSMASFSGNMGVAGVLLLGLVKML